MCDKEMRHPLQPLFHVPCLLSFYNLKQRRCQLERFPDSDRLTFAHLTTAITGEMVRTHGQTDRRTCGQTDT